MSALLRILTLLYLASGVLVLTTSVSIGQAAANMVLDIAVLYSFSYFCLSLLDYLVYMERKKNGEQLKYMEQLKYRPRFVQMVPGLYSSRFTICSQRNKALKSQLY